MVGEEEAGRCNGSCAGDCNGSCEGTCEAGCEGSCEVGERPRASPSLSLTVADEWLRGDERAGGEVCTQAYGDDALIAALGGP